MKYGTIKEFKPDIKRYALKSVLWFILIRIIENNFAKNDIWFVILSIFILSVPIALSGIYINTVRQIHRLNTLTVKGILFSIISRRALRVIFWTLWAIISSFFIFIQFHTYTNIDWFTFFLVIPIFGYVFTIFKKINERERKPYLVLMKSLEYSRYIVPFIMLIIYVLLSYLVIERIEYSTLEAAIISKKEVVSDITSSALVRKASLYLANYSGSVAFVVGRIDLLTTNIFFKIMLLGIGNLAIFYNACAILSCFLIPRIEYRRIFGTLTVEDVPQKVSHLRVAGITAVTVFISLFIYLQLFLGIDGQIKKTHIIVSARENVSNVLNITDKGGNKWYKSETKDSIEKVKLETLLSMKSAHIQLEHQIDQAFNNIEANVDDYLDWHYSLTGEYVRISKMLVNELDAYMVKKLEEYLQQGDVFNDIEFSITRELKQVKQSKIAYNKTIQNILDKNRIYPLDSSKYKVVENIELKTLSTLLYHQDIIDIDNRLTVSSGVGVTTGVMGNVVIKGIIKKVTSKSILKSAAKVLSKIILSKTAGAFGGVSISAGIGATIGSIIPVAGTAAGAVVGGILGGVIIGSGVDKIMIELEENMSREEFKTDIIGAIREAKDDFKIDYFSQTNNLKK